MRQVLRNRSRGWLVGVILVAAMASPGTARTIEGYPFDESVRMGPVNLQLNGVGVRAVSIFKGYVAALYVPKRSSDPAQLLVEAGPKRMAMRMLLSADSATFVKAVTGGLQRNSSGAELARLEPQISAFNENLRQVKGVKPGDLVMVDFEPALGTRVSLNGQNVGTPVAGAEFYVAFLKIFIGEKVQDLPLKAGLLGSRSPR